MIFYIIGFIFAAFFILLGLRSLWQALSLLMKARASRSWPQTVGTVTASTVKFSSAAKTGRNYWAEVEYSYHVLGAEFRGKFKVHSFWGTEAKANSIVATYPSGMTLNVQYHAQQRQISITEYDRVSASEVIAALFMIVGGLLYMCIPLIFPSEFN